MEQSCSNSYSRPESHIPLSDGQGRHARLRDIRQQQPPAESFTADGNKNKIGMSYTAKIAFGGQSQVMKSP